MEKLVLTTLFLIIIIALNLSENETIAFEDIACKIIATMMANKSISLHDNSNCSEVLEQEQRAEVQ